MGKLRDIGEYMLDRAFPMRGPARKSVEAATQTIEAIPEKDRARAARQAENELVEASRAWNRAIQRTVMPNSEAWKREAELANKPVPRSNKFEETGMDKGEFKKGGKVRTASSRADGIAKRGKTRGKVY